MEKRDELFVGLKEPLELRRDLLESSKAIIVSLKSFHSHKTVHELKLQEYGKLKQVIKELERLTAKLRVHLPKAKLTTIIEERRQIRSILPHDKKLKTPKVVKKVKKPKEPQDEEATIQQPLSKPKSDLERLEHELSEIENKLSKLD